MTVELTEQRLGQLRWLVVEGPARDAFTALAGWPDLERLRAQVAEPPMNLRGDLGVREDDPDGIGRSDISWRRQRSLIAHNEDESSYSRAAACCSRCCWTASSR